MSQQNGDAAKLRSDYEAAVQAERQAWAKLKSFSQNSSEYVTVANEWRAAAKQVETFAKKLRSGV